MNTTSLRTVFDWWESLEEDTAIKYGNEYLLAVGRLVNSQLDTSDIRKIWAVKANETDEDRKIQQMANYFRECESIKVLQIPAECLSNNLRSKFYNFRPSFKDTDKDLNENIYPVSLFEDLYEIFPEGHECYTEVKALDQVCSDLCYSYIQITTT